jgi:hypothetical protein
MYMGAIVISIGLPFLVTCTIIGYEVNQVCSTLRWNIKVTAQVADNPA